MFTVVVVLVSVCLLACVTGCRYELLIISRIESSGGGFELDVVAVVVMLVVIVVVMVVVMLVVMVVVTEVVLLFGLSSS